VLLRQVASRHRQPRSCQPLLRRHPPSWSVTVDAIEERDPFACFLFLRVLPRDCALTG
jgi:hypothetical protein